MIIDKSHREWILATTGLFFLSTAVYLWGAWSPEGPRADSLIGVSLGLASAAMMLFAGLLTLRKKFPRWSIGAVKTWLRGHIWLGLLSGPLALYHAGFRWGGLLETWLLALVGLIILSGLWGLAMQSLLPRIMRITTPLEASPDQIPQVCRALVADADRQVKTSCGSLLNSDDDGRDEPRRLRDFYRTTVRPFLSAEWGPGKPRLWDRVESETLFSEVQTLLPDGYHGVLRELSQMCEERRQLALHMRLHGWLNSWMLVHLPLSTALLVFLTAHIVMSFVIY